MVCALLFLRSMFIAALTTLEHIDFGGTDVIRRGCHSSYYPIPRACGVA